MPNSPPIDPAGRFRASDLHTTGRDGFRYILAFRDESPLVRDVVPQPLADIATTALDGGAGIVIYRESPGEERPLRVFTLGEASLLARDAWPSSYAGSPPTIGDGDVVYLGTPDPTIFPPPLRSTIASFLRETCNVAIPKLALVGISTGDVVRPPYAVTANLVRADYPDEAAWQLTLDRLAWFIPPEFATLAPPSPQARCDRWFAEIEPLESRP